MGSNRCRTELTRKRKLLIKIILQLFCFVGFVFHSIDKVKEYLSYTHVTKTAFEYPEYFQPPSVSLCFKLHGIHKLIPQNNTRRDCNDTCLLSFLPKKRDEYLLNLYELIETISFRSYDVYYDDL